MKAFISYQTTDKLVAAQIKQLLSEVNIDSFMAHEDIHVSDEWRLKILEEIENSKVFLSLWSRNYCSSFWCIQESGIASYHKDMIIIPLSLDGTTPQAFSSSIQSIKVDPNNVLLEDLLPGLRRVDPNIPIKIIFKSIAEARSYRGAEARFKPILSYKDALTNEQGKELLEISLRNDQVCNAGLCAQTYLPEFMARYGHLLEPEDYNELIDILACYAK
ncbi:toll/interleukin-1 receptor domain-containing protein [Marinomonas sp. TW1]|uniref:toll/interleukin-1 receptor domain-containing protein n=1 Tax=Marinomonas sp. TW1 TaxID=1561203 RepID=UPI0007AF024B|nr:toll/interleukin-1 receptor domain-containing protein [Marinomonas sp. TW1]